MPHFITICGIFFYVKRILPILSVAAFTVMLIVKPQYFINSAGKGMALFCTAVLPALFPFFFCSTLLTKLGAAETISKLFEKPVKFLFNSPSDGAYAMLISFMCGYPVGASVICDLYRGGRLTTSDCRKLIAFCSTSGPIFILGTIGTVIFNDVHIGIILLVGHYLAAVINGIIFSGRRLKKSSDATPSIEKKTRIRSLKELHSSLKKKHHIQTIVNDASTMPKQCLNNDTHTHARVVALDQTSENFNNTTSNLSVDNVLSEAVSKATLTMLTLGGYIVLGNMLIDCMALLLPKLPTVFGVVAYGGIEMTRGCMLSFELSFPFSIAAAAAILSFGGLSVQFQSMSFLSVCGVRYSSLLLRKICQSAMAFAITLALSLVFAKFLA